MHVVGDSSIAGQLFRTVLGLLLFCISIGRVDAQSPGSLDLSFDPTGGGQLLGFTENYGEIYALEMLAEGKLLFAGQFVGYNGKPRYGIARANTDCSIDSAFEAGAKIDGAILAAAVQSDGKVVVGGQFMLLNSQPRFSLTRLATDGNLDPGFVADVKMQAEKGSVRALALQADGKIMVGGSFDRINGVISFSLARVNTDGSVDRTFSSGELFRQSGTIHALAVLDDGKVLVAGFLGSQAVIRCLNSDGTPNPGFTNELTGYEVSALAVRSDGRILAAGEVKLPSGSWPEEALVLLNADGSVAQAFSVLKTQITALQVQPDNKVIITGWFHQIRGVPRLRVARLNADGSLDESFDPADTLGNVSDAVVPKLAGGGGVWLAGHFDLPNGTSTALVRLRPDGRLDEVFQSQASAVSIAKRPGSITAAVVLSGGEVLVGGTFDAVNDTPRPNLAQLLPNGLLDSSFQPQWSNGLEVVKLLRQGDGRLLVGGRGSFTDTDGRHREGLVRLNADGSLDRQFISPWSDTWNMRLHCLALQSDNKILAGGEFGNGLVRLNPNGTFDETFQPPSLPAYDGDAVYAVLVQPDGRIIAGGTQTIGLFRLNPDGSPDPSFRCDPGLISSVNALALQSDGILVGGWLYASGEDRNRNLVRLWSDGTLDHSFKAEITVIPQQIVPLPGGRILLSGAAAYPSQAAQIYCLMPDGSQDTNFSASAGVQFGIPAVQSISVMEDGRVLAGGIFSTVNGQPMDGIARLHNQFLSQAPKIYSGPVSLTRFVGQTAQFNVQCAGAPALSYQWFFNGQSLPDKTDSALSLGPLTTEDVGHYAVIVSNTVGSVTSDMATLTILPVPAGPGSVDISFDPSRGGRLVPVADSWSGNTWERAVSTLVAQPDGRMVIGGFFSGIDGVPRNNVARLQADGRLDLTFDTSWGADGEVTHISRQADAKLILAGWFVTVQGTRRTGIARLNEDGTLDQAFEVKLEWVEPKLVVWRTWVQPNGRLLVFGAFDHVNGVPRYSLARLNSDGSLDQSFNADSTTSVTLARVDTCELLHDGLLLLGGEFPTAAGRHMVRLNSDGSLDPGFVPWFSSGGIFAIAEQSDGKVLVSTSQDGVLRLNPDGSADPAFTPAQVGGGYWVSDLGILWDGRILLGGSFTSVNGVVGFQSLAVLKQNGILDSSLNLPVLMAGTHGDSFAMLPDGRAVIFADDDQVADYWHSFYLLEPPNTFRLFFTNTFSARSSIIDHVLTQPDGKIIISGRFSYWNEVRCPGYTRLLEDGTLDPNFYVTTGPMYGVQCHTLDADGKILITAAFPVQEEQFYERHALGRLESYGGLDYSFGAGTVDVEESIATPNTVALQPDGKVLVAGYPYRNPAEHPSIARYHADGTLDLSFHPTPVYVGDDYGILELGIQSDGKIVLGGELVPVRYLPNGDLDPTFNSDILWGTLQRVIVLPDDRLLISGWFTVSDDMTWLNVARLLSNGRLDTSFNAPPGFVYTIAAQSDGRVLVAYENELVRLNPNGSIDPSFPSVKPNAPVRRITLQTDGRILLAGDFTAVNRVPCHGLARLNNIVLPVLRPVRVTPGQPFTLSLTGTPGVYSMEMSRNLGDWAVIGSVTNGPSGRCEFAAQPANEACHFYRAKRD